MTDPAHAASVGRSTLNPTLTLLLRTALYAAAAFSLASTIAMLREISAFDDLMGTSRSVLLVDLAAAEQFSEGFSQLALWVGVAAGVITIVWWWRAYQAIAAVATVGRSWSPGWAVGGWFIPIGNVIIPKLVLNEIDRVSRAAAKGEVDDWRREPLTVLPHWWWLFWVLGVVLGIGGASISGGQLTAAAFDGGVYRSGLLMTAWGYGASTVAGFLGAASVRVIGARLQPQ